jgi:ABC transporter DrrB family efflux protein
MAQAVQIAVGKPSAWTWVTELIADTAVMTRRNLLVWVRMPSFLIITLVQPIIFVLLFRFVFGGAIKVTNPGGYVEYLMPGIIAQTAAMASIATAIALARTMSRGIVDRYRSMPMARPAFLGGWLTADAVRILVTLIVIMVIGYLVGFRFRAGWEAAIAMMGLALAFGVAMCCVMAFTGLAIRNEEAVQGYGLVWLFPLTFVSSAFVPVASMPGWLQPFARNQPVTVVIDAMRALTLGGPVASSAWKAVAWILGITVVFMFLSVRSYIRN